MKRTERETMGVVTDILDAAGLAWTTRRGKHLCVVITAADGSQHTIPIAGSPRAGMDAQRNWARQDTLRLLEHLGVPADRGARIAPRKTSHRRCNSDRAVFVFEHREPGRLDRDPWAKLEALR